MPDNILGFQCVCAAYDTIQGLSKAKQLFYHGVTGSNAWQMIYHAALMAYFFYVIYSLSAPYPSISGKNMSGWF